MLSQVFIPCTTLPKKIGGEYVDVTNLVPAGTEPHDWEPSTTDITSLEHADVFVYNGAGMESWTDKVLSTLSNKSLTTVEASQNISLREGGEHEHDEDENHTNEENHDEEHYDPHVWLNPLNAKKENGKYQRCICKTTLNTNSIMKIIIKLGAMSVTDYTTNIRKL